MKAGHLTTFYRLLMDEQMIVIPKVQRDYVYGRIDGKAPKILDVILNSMLSTLRHNRQEIYDFIYGGAYEKNGQTHAGMIPLDGQQRLTTLFLLHFYASVIQHIPAEETTFLKGFRYETRQSANDFGTHLLGPMRENILKCYTPDIKICDLIRNDALYSPTYANDPTISSMLVVLEAIESKFRTFIKTRFRRTSIGLWDALTTRDNLCFYHITLDRFGLSDDLYIKMNSRGKSLTDFEIFKADLEERIRAIYPEKVDMIACKIDTRWIDMIWSQYRSEPQKADSAYMILINNILRLLWHWKKGETSHIDADLLHSTISTHDDVDMFESIMDIMYKVYLKGFADEWNKHFYHDSDTILGKAEKIRQFTGAMSGTSIFIVAMSHRMTNPELVQLLGSYLVENSALSPADSLKALRITRNLITANQRANNFRIIDMPGFLSDIEHIVANITKAPIPAKTTFLSTAAEEEAFKINLNQSDYEHLLRYENHKVLSGSVALFMNEYIPDGSKDCTNLFNQLDHFEKIFDNNCMSMEGFEKIRTNLINLKLDYWQWEYADLQGDDTRYLFIHTPNDYTDFLTANKRRHNQHAILKIIATLPSADMLVPHQTKCQEFAISDFRYYMSKYYASNSTETKYGYYGWHNIMSYPLDVYLLNSSYFGSTNLAWSMMLHILHDKFYNHPVHKGNMSWDPHQAPLHFTKIDLVVDFIENRWIITTSTQTISDRLASLSKLIPITPSKKGNITSYTLYNSRLSRPDYVECIASVINALTNRFSLLPRGWINNRFALIGRNSG